MNTPVHWQVWVRRSAGSLAAAWLLLPLVAGQARAAAVDDRPAITQFVASGVISTRRLQQDLGRALWPPQELRSAVARAYGVSTVGLDRYLASPAGRALLNSAVPWWSADLSPQVRLAALQAALLADSRDGSISLLGVLQQLPVRFALREGPQQPAVAGASCGCPADCGTSALAHLAFLIACLQAGSMAPVGR